MNAPTQLFATKTEIERAKSGNDPECARKYIEALEEIAEAALKLDSWEDPGPEDWDRLRVALGKVYIR